MKTGPERRARWLRHCGLEVGQGGPLAEAGSCLSSQRPGKFRRTRGRRPRPSGLRGRGAAPGGPTAFAAAIAGTAEEEERGRVPAAAAWAWGRRGPSLPRGFGTRRRRGGGSPRSSLGRAEGKERRVAWAGRPLPRLARGRPHPAGTEPGPPAAGAPTLRRRAAPAPPASRERPCPAPFPLRRPPRPPPHRHLGRSGIPPPPVGFGGRTPARTARGQLPAWAVGGAPAGSRVPPDQ